MSSTNISIKKNLQVEFLLLWRMSYYEHVVHALISLINAGNVVLLSKINLM